MAKKLVDIPDHAVILILMKCRLPISLSIINNILLTSSTTGAKRTCCIRSYAVAMLNDLISGLFFVESSNKDELLCSK
jgi:hypothetical protein